ncbi:MAG: helix-turn-helix transcriptional regulator [Clostridia bacterium]|nr:helix-turn-helix transcriptional regulator [Clostridia bacterium]
MSVFSERLTALMKAKGFSQKEFAKRANVTESAMSYYVKGVRTPSGEVLARIARALDTTADYLLGSTDSIEVPEEQKELKYLQRNLGKLDDKQLKTAEKMLKLMFNDIFEDDDEE